MIRRENDIAAVVVPVVAAILLVALIALVITLASKHPPRVGASATFGHSGTPGAPLVVETTTRRTHIPSGPPLIMQTTRHSHNAHMPLHPPVPRAQRPAPFTVKTETTRHIPGQVSPHTPLPDFNLRPGILKTQNSPTNHDRKVQFVFGR